MKKVILGLGGLFLFLNLSSAYAESKCAQKLSKEKLVEGLRKEKEEGIKKIAHVLKKENRIPTAAEVAAIFEVGPRVLTKKFGRYDALLLEALTTYPDAVESVRSRLIKNYITLSRKNMQLPTADELAEKLGISREEFNALMGSQFIFKDLSDLKVSAVAANPDAFEDVKNDELYTPERREALMKALRECNEFVYSAVMVGRGFPIEDGFFEALKTYHEKTGAPVILKAINNRTMYLDERLVNTPWIHILINDIELSPWLRLNTIEQLPKQINPTTGLTNRWPRNQTQLVASPKVSVKSVAMSQKEIPHIIATTGTISEPRYAEQNAKTVQRRMSRLAAEDHFVGAIVVEKTNANGDLLGLNGAGDFKWRHIQYIPKIKGFLDKKTYYTATGTFEVKKFAALVLGDTHAVKNLDQRTLKPIADLIATGMYKVLVLHDFIEPEPLNHHEQDMGVTMAKKAARGELDLSKSFDQVAAFINAILALDPNIDIVLDSSNHPNWIYKWLENKKFLEDPVNSALGGELFAVMERGEDPIEYLLLKKPLRFDSDREYYRQTRIQEPQRVKVIPRGRPGLNIGPNDFLTDLGQHGHEGSNGAGASIRSIHESTMSAMFGHYHYYGRLNDTVQLGTITYLDLGYNTAGASSWNQTIGVVGPYGEKQVYMFQNGEFFRPDNQKLIPPDRFWFRDIKGVQYPRETRYLEPLEGGQDVDQYSEPPANARAAHEN